MAYERRQALEHNAFALRKVFAYRDCAMTLDQAVKQAIADHSLRHDRCNVTPLYRTGRRSKKTPRTDIISNALKALGNNGRLHLE